MENWYLQFKGQQVGPMKEEQLWIYNPDENSLVWREGMAEWMPIYAIPELMQKLNTMKGQKQAAAKPASHHAAPATPVNHDPKVPPTVTPKAVPTKSKATFGIIALLSGIFSWCFPVWGIQYLYVGKKTAGISLLIGGVALWLLTWVIIPLITVGTSFITFGLTGIFSLFTFIFQIIVGLFFLVQGIVVLINDQEKFERTFVDNEKGFPLM